MNEYHQFPTLYVLAITAILCGAAALIFAILNFANLQRNHRHIKSVARCAEDLKELLHKVMAEQIQKKNIMEKSLRELEHDHDIIKNAVDSYVPAINRIENAVNAIKETQQSYINNKSASDASGNKNKIKIAPPHTPEAYENSLLTAVLRQLIDKVQERPPQPPNT